MAVESAAPRTGGRATSSSATYEAMNAMGELRDVVPATYDAFVDAESQSRRQTAWSSIVRSGAPPEGTGRRLIAR